MGRLAMLLVWIGLAAPAWADPSRLVARIQPLALHDGINRLQAFLPDGADATVVQAWRENGNAHGHHDWVILGPGTDGHSVDVVTVEDPGTGMLRDTVGDAPFDGERVLGALRFARGEVDGRPASLLIEVVLDDPPSGIPADHAIAILHIYRLEATAGDPGDSPLEFRPILSRRSRDRFCNAELALARMLTLPLPGDYGGPNRVDGCFRR